MTSLLSEVAYDRIRARLLDGRLSVEKKVSEVALSRELGTSRTPVREAIRRLHAEGLLYQVPSSGTFVVQLDRFQLIETFEIREALECFLIGKAIRRMKRPQVESLREHAETMRAAARDFRDSGAEVLEGEPMRRFLAADWEFHLLLLNAAKNRTAMKMVSDAKTRNRIFGHSSHHRDLPHVALVCLFHMRIAQAARRRDVRSARRWMKAHIRSSRRAALVAFDEQHAAKQALQGGSALHLRQGQ